MILFKIILFTTIAVWFTSIAFCTNYYVDAMNGSDNNNGISKKNSMEVA